MYLHQSAPPATLKQSADISDDLIIRAFSTVTAGPCFVSGAVKEACLERDPSYLLELQLWSVITDGYQCFLWSELSRGRKSLRSEAETCCHRLVWAAVQRSPSRLKVFEPEVTGPQQINWTEFVHEPHPFLSLVKPGGEMRQRAERKT